MSYILIKYFKHDHLFGLRMKTDNLLNNSVGWFDCYNTFPEIDAIMNLKNNNKSYNAFECGK